MPVFGREKSGKKTTEKKKTTFGFRFTTLVIALFSTWYVYIMYRLYKAQDSRFPCLRQTKLELK